MEKQFTVNDILNANQVHLYNNSCLYIVIGDEAYGFTECGSGWFHKENFEDYFESDNMMSYFTRITKEEAAQLYMGWTKDPAADCMRLNEAIKFAVDRHAGQFRKATVRPYISHPLEAMVILQSMDADINLQIAGVLHDTIEDTDATEDDIRALFGDDVADLVTSHSEDKSKTWDERKSTAIEELARADKRLKMLIMADKVSNLRSMSFDYARVGEELWNRFNANVKKQAWYYSGIQDALIDMQSYPECADVYWEMVGLYKDLFVSYYIDHESEVIYQVCMDDEKVYLEKGNPEWKNVVGELPDSAILIDRTLAERTIDDWNVSFWEQHKSDLKNAQYFLYSSRRRCFDIAITDNELVLHCEDFGPECEKMTGKDEYEFYYQLSEDSTHRFLARLRIETDLNTPLNELLKLHFGEDNGPRKFEEFCDRNQVKYQRFCI